MKLNGKPIRTKIGIVYVGHWKGKWTIVAHNDNKNLLVRGSKGQYEQILKEIA